MSKDLEENKQQLAECLDLKNKLEEQIKRLSSNSELSNAEWL